MGSKATTTKSKAAAKKAPAARKSIAQQQIDGLKAVMVKLDALVEAMKPTMHTEALDEAHALQVEIKSLAGD